MKLAFLGAGNMAGAMIQSILAADVLKGDEILLVNARNPAHGKETAARLGITAAEPAALRTADAIVFAMKPQDFSAAAAMYRSYLENQLVLSIMAGISFKKLEKELDKKIKRTPADHPGYNEYQYHLDPIEHDPWQLTSFLTTLYDDYTRFEVQGKLKETFKKQYKLTTWVEVQIR